MTAMKLCVLSPGRENGIPGEGFAGGLVQPIEENGKTRYLNTTPLRCSSYILEQEYFDFFHWQVKIFGWREKPFRSWLAQISNPQRDIRGSKQRRETWLRKWERPDLCTSWRLSLPAGLFSIIRSTWADSFRKKKGSIIHGMTVAYCMSPSYSWLWRP